MSKSVNYGRIALKASRIASILLLLLSLVLIVFALQLYHDAVKINANSDSGQHVSKGNQQVFLDRLGAGVVGLIAVSVAVTAALLLSGSVILIIFTTKRLKRNALLDDQLIAKHIPL
jgi:hypothetical protein